MECNLNYIIAKFYKIVNIIRTLRRVGRMRFGRNTYIVCDRSAAREVLVRVDLFDR